MIAGSNGDVRAGKLCSNRYVLTGTVLTQCLQGRTVMCERVNYVLAGMC